MVEACPSRLVLTNSRGLHALGIDLAENTVFFGMGQNLLQFIVVHVASVFVLLLVGFQVRTLKDESVD